MAYRVTISRDAQRALARINARDRQRLAQAIDGLADDPHPPGTRALQGRDALLRLRVGDYRIVYTVIEAPATPPASEPPPEASEPPSEEDQKTPEPGVRVILIGHRRDVYRQPLR